MTHFLKLHRTSDSQDVWVNPFHISHFHGHPQKGTIIYFATSLAEGQEMMVVAEPPQEIALDLKRLRAVE